MNPKNESGTSSRGKKWKTDPEWVQQCRTRQQKAAVGSERGDWLISLWRVGSCSSSCLMVGTERVQLRQSRGSRLTWANCCDTCQKICVIFLEHNTTIDSFNWRYKMIKCNEILKIYWFVKFWFEEYFLSYYRYGTILGKIGFRVTDALTCRWRGCPANTFRF